MNRKSLYLLTIFLSLTGTSFSDSAWWLTETYPPTGNTVESLPVNLIDDKWEAATVLTKECLSKEGQDYFEMIRTNKEFESLKNSDFSMDGDFNKDGIKDRAVVGTYREKSGNTGRFLLVLTREKGGWKKAFLETAPSDPGFSVLYKFGNDLIWSTCFECDSGGILVWDRNHYSVDYSYGGD